MANRMVPKRQIDAEVFKRYIHNRNISIRDLGEMTDITEKTLRRCLVDGEMTITVVLEMCYFFNTTANTLFGPDKSATWYQSIYFLTQTERGW